MIRFFMEYPLLFLGVAVFLLGALVSLCAGFFSPRHARHLAFGIAALASALSFFAGISALLGLGAENFIILSLGQLGTLSFGTASAVSALFLCIISFVGFAASVFSIAYSHEAESEGYSIGWFGFLYNVFLLSMVMVVASQNAALFMVAWEFMALSSFFLVTLEHRDEHSVEAGFSYFLVTHVAAILLVVMFLLLASATGGSFDFAAFALAPYSRFVADAIFVLALLGFGAKAGMIPLHMWLPLAHPRAPSNVSALMSGVMLKTGIYGLVIVLFSFLKVGSVLPPLWWGIALLVVGAVSAVLGVLYSLLEHDLKRMLAMHSIENIGIILLGLGASVLLLGMNMPALAAVGLFAALFHTLNHALFKSLLFMGAGSIAYSAHTKNIERMGGLVKLMPLTAVFFLVGSASIAAIPPLNGFASEWLTFQALLSGSSNVGVLGLVFIAAVILLAVTSALAVVAFTKAFGICFLGLPRSESVGKAAEVPKSMLAGMAVLALACVGTGLFPQAVLSLFAPALSWLGVSDFSGLAAASSHLPSFAVFAVLAIAIIAVALIDFFARRASSARDGVGDTWDCGIFEVTPKMQYSATGFAMPVTRVFARWLNPFKRNDASGPAVFEFLFYRPLVAVFLFFSRLSRLLQTGNLVHYMSYVIVTLLVVLFFAVV